MRNEIINSTRNDIVLYLATEKKLLLLELKEPLILQLRENDECNEVLNENTQDITVYTLKLYVGERKMNISTRILNK